MSENLGHFLFQVDWCTGFSDGYHKMTFTLDLVDSSDVTNGDQCQQYKLQHIPESNIHLLVLANRTSSGCNDLAIIVSKTTVYDQLYIDSTIP